MEKLSLVQRIDDWINPIAVKEIRQAVKGKFISRILMQFMGLQTVIIGLVLLFSGMVSMNFDLGRDLFMGLLSVLLGICLLFLPAFAAFRLASERSDKNVDLFFITTIKPYQIIGGKVLVGMVLTLLFFSANLPFMTLTYLLRGIDLPTMFVLMGLDFMVVAVAIQFGVTVASFPAKGLTRGLYFTIAFGAVVAMFFVSFAFTSDIVYYGLGGSLGSWDFWGPALSTMFLIAAAMGLMFVIAVAAITPSTTNKAFLPRGYIAFIWLVTGIGSACWAIVKHDRAFVLVWMFAVISFLCLHVFIAICERETFGPRLRASIPHNFFLRRFYFIFSSGSAGGILFSIILMGLTFAFVYPFVGMVFGVGRLDDEFYIPIAFATYTLGYCLLGLMIKRKFFANSTKPGLATIITALVCFAGSVLPPLIGFLLKDESCDFVDEIWYAGSPFVIFYEKDLLFSCTFCSGIAAGFFFVCSLPWIVGQFAKFKPLPKLIFDEMQATPVSEITVEVQDVLAVESAAVQQENSSDDEAGDE